MHICSGKFSIPLLLVERTTRLHQLDMHGTRDACAMRLHEPGTCPFDAKVNPGYIVQVIVNLRVETCLFVSMLHS